MFPSMSVRRGDICLCHIILKGICMWALGSWGGERSSSHVPSVQRQPAKPEPGQGKDWALTAHGARPGLEKCTCKRNTKALPAAGSNLLLFLMMIDKKLMVNRGLLFLHLLPFLGSPTLPVPHKASLGYCLGQDQGCGRPQRYSTAYLMHFNCSYNHHVLNLIL